ncbi:MAG TPA: serine hydrolase domain-containing protein [Acidimicrobiales bacterium]|nr:serine hydrolase domain-containing protein [Acidimicrobiales bacterium]
MVDIHGEVAPGFAKVRDAFAANFEHLGEVGAAFALYQRGRKVVDLWGGLADQESGRAWEEDTLQVVFSTTKGATAACAHLLAQRGLLDYDAPVAEYWPEFKAAGKKDIPVRWVMSHRAGLPVVDATLTPQQVYAWDPIVAALAAQAPVWKPGTTHGYHAVTYGYLLGELIRRVSGKRVGEFLADEIAGPLGVEFYIGLPAAEAARVSTLLTIELGISGEQRASLRDLDLDLLPENIRALAKAFLDPNSLSIRALNLCDPPFDFNDPDFHAAEVPAANGITNARNLARLYAGLIGDVDGVRILDDATIEAARTEQSVGPDAILIKDTRFGLGFMLDQPDVPLLGAGSFGHDGAGGSLGFADPESGIAFGYVMNKMNANINADPRADALIEAVRASL